MSEINQMLDHMRECLKPVDDDNFYLHKGTRVYYHTNGLDCYLFNTESSNEDAELFATAHVTALNYLLSNESLDMDKLKAKIAAQSKEIEKLNSEADYIACLYENQSKEIAELEKFVSELMGLIKKSSIDCPFPFVQNELERVMSLDAWKKREGKHLTAQEVQGVISKMDKDL